MEFISTKCILYLIFTASHFTLFNDTVSITCVGSVAVQLLQQVTIREKFCSISAGTSATVTDAIQSLFSSVPLGKHQYRAFSYPSTVRFQSGTFRYLIIRTLDTTV